MTSVKCRLGRHQWETHRNPDAAGKDAVYELCRRCGKERDAYGPAVPGSIAMGG